MPVIGEVKRGHEIGYKQNFRYIWLACEVCGKERWVQVESPLGQSTKCKSCSLKYSGKAFARIRY